MSNVLLLSAGRRVALFEGFLAACAKIGCKAFAADSDPQLSAVCESAESSFTLPNCHSPTYSKALAELCRELAITVVVPTIDTELPVLAALKKSFANLGVAIVVSDSDLIVKCADKRLTSQLFLDHGVRTPELYDPTEIEYPVFVKPYDGSLSAGIELVKFPNELTQRILENERNIFCEYIDPTDYSEYTIDMYYDRHSELKCAVPRLRIQVRGGEVSKGKTDKSCITEKLFRHFKYLQGAIGCLTLQLFKHNDTDEMVFIEVNARFGGGFPLAMQARADYPKWLLDEYILSKDIDVFHDWTDQLLMLRYDSAVYVGE